MKGRKVDIKDGGHEENKNKRRHERKRKDYKRIKRLKIVNSCNGLSTI